MGAVSLQLLLLLGTLCLAPLAAGQPKAPLKCSTECSHFASGIAAKRIRSYRRSEPRCTKQAVIFTTLKSLEICADPEADWVKDIVEKLDQKKASATPRPRDATPAVAPEEPGLFRKRVGLAATAPTQATAPTGFFQGTSTTALEGRRVPAAVMEVASRSPPAPQDTTLLPAGLSPTTREAAACSRVTPGANRDSLKSPAPATASAAGVGSILPAPCPTALVHGFGEATGSTEGPVGPGANALADVQGTASPSSDPAPAAVTEGPDHPAPSVNESLDPTGTRAGAVGAASSSWSSELPSAPGSIEMPMVPATPAPPATAPVPTPSPTTFHYPSPTGKRGPSATLVFTGQAFPSQARAQPMAEGPSRPPLPSLLPQFPADVVIPVAVLGSLMACGVAVVWLYLKFGIKPEAMAREMGPALLEERAPEQHLPLDAL